MLVIGGLLFAAMANEVLLSWRTRFRRSKVPQWGEALETPPLRVTIKYDAPIEKLFASLHVLGPASKDEAMVTADMKPGEQSQCVSHLPRDGIQLTAVDAVHRMKPAKLQ